MKYTSHIDNVTSQRWGLSIQEAYVFDFLYSLPSWAEKLILGNDVYYFASKTKVIEEIPLLTDKVDTMYRYYKKLEGHGVISLKKVDNKDYVMLTKKGKEWNRKIESESDYSENNPNQLGKLSESSSENNPTYKNTIIDKNTSNNIYIEVDSFRNDEKFMKVWSDWCSHVNYKSQHAARYAFESLHRECLGDVKKAIESIEYSLSNNWNSIHPKEEKEKNSAKKEKQNNGDTKGKFHPSTISELNHRPKRRHVKGDTL